jgi:hypothetical protein
MTPEEQHLKKFTHANLMRLPNWSKWDEDFDAQLDNHRETGALAELIPHSEGCGINGKKSHILHVHWQNVVKIDGTWKCRACSYGWFQMSSALASSVCSDVCFLHRAAMHAVVLCLICCIGPCHCLC